MSSRAAATVAGAGRYGMSYGTKPPGFGTSSTGRGGRAAFDGLDDEDEPKKRSPFPSLAPRPAGDRTDEIIEHLEEMILNPGRADGKTGMHYQDWKREARLEIRTAIEAAESAAAFKELMSANRIGGLCLRVGFLLLASVASFAAFWWGVVLIGTTYGAIWGVAATLSALGLSLGFVTAGLVWGSENEDDARYKAMSRPHQRKP